jgi:hypothetical protein
MAALATDSAEAGAPVDEIEITPAMVEAGAVEVASYDPECGTSRDVAIDVFRAMLRARPPLLQD